MAEKNYEQGYADGYCIGYIDGEKKKDATLDDIESAIRAIQEEGVCVCVREDGAFEDMRALMNNLVSVMAGIEGILRNSTTQDGELTVITCSDDPLML